MLAVVAVVIVVAAACLVGCDSGGGAVEPSSSGSVGVGSLVPDEMPESKDSMERPEMPLDYYFGLISRANGQFTDTVAAGDSNWEVKQEEFIAACMKKQGFQYEPRDVKALVDGPSDIVGGVPTTVYVPWLPESRADVERYGYGYYYPPEETDHGPISQVDPEIEVEPDPNADYVASLSKSARREYEVALYGADWSAYDLSSFESAAAPEMGGCTGQAWEEHPAPVVRAFDESPVKSTYSDLVDEIYIQDAPDPLSWALEDESIGSVFLGAAQIDSLNSEWLECFTDEYGEVVLPDPDESPKEAMDVVLPAEVHDPHGAWVVAELIGSDGGFWVDVGYAPEEYRSLAARPKEIEVALADFDCRQKTDYLDRYFEIMRDSQNQFIAEHKSELDEMAAAIEQYVA
jgi:hypothetical protein